MADQIVTSSSNGLMRRFAVWEQAVNPDTGLMFSGQDLRQLPHLFAGSQVGGVQDGFHMVVTPGPGMSVNVGYGRAGIPGSAIAYQGMYAVTSMGTVNVPVPLATTAGTRTHHLVCEIIDKSVSGTDYGWQFRVIEDTTGSVPPLPASAISLAYITVPAGSVSVTASMIADRRGPIGHSIGVALRRTTIAGPLAANSRTPIAWNSTDDDLFHLTNLTADPLAVTLRHNGLYDISLGCGVGPSAGEFECGIYVNNDTLGGIIPGFSVKTYGSPLGNACGFTQLAQPFLAGTVLRAYVWSQTSPVNMTYARMAIYRREFR